MGWEWRVFFQATDGAPPPLQWSPGDVEARTDTYYVLGPHVGLKKRGGGRLELKERLNVDECAYEKWQKREAQEAPPSDAPCVSLEKRRRQECRASIKLEHTELRVSMHAAEAQPDADQHWRTVALEGKRERCEELREELLAACRAQAVGGAVLIGGYPAFVSMLAGDATAFALSRKFCRRCVSCKSFAMTPKFEPV